MLKVGEVFLERFEIESILGQGGFASVFKARQEKLNRSVAIKVLRLDDEVARKRFEQEARVISGLRDPATVTVHDYGESEGRCYMILELVEGQTLRQLIDHDGALSPDRVVSILTQIVGSLVEAHDHDILHRDIKPENIMVFDHYESRDRVKVLDFGIAKLLSEGGNMSSEGPVTAAGEIVGTPRYMAPEMLRGWDVGPAADVFSLGMVAYEMLTGERAVKSTKGMEIIARLLDDNPIMIPPGADLPNQLSDVVNRMMEKSQDTRIGTARDVAMALRSMPAAPPSTVVFSPEQMAQLRTIDHAQSGGEREQTVQAVPVKPVKASKPGKPKKPEEPKKPKKPKKPAKRPKKPGVSDVDAAIARLKDDADRASGRLISVSLFEASTSDEEPVPKAGRRSAKRNKGKSRKDKPARSRQKPKSQNKPNPNPRGTLPAAEPRRDAVPPPTMRMPDTPRDLRDYVGFVVLGIALFLAASYYVGLVGVEPLIRDGDSEDCEAREISIVTERHAVAFGSHVFKVSEYQRCEEE